MAIAPGMIEAAQWAADQFSAGQPGNRAVRNAFLSWWAAEDGWDWPTNSRNNPGNLRPAGDSTGSVGISTGLHPGFYIYATPGDGVAMMCQRIKRSTHYPGIRSALAAVAAGQATADAVCVAVGRSPWGTNTSTMRSTLAYATKHAGATPSGTGWATVHRLGPSSGSGLPEGIPASSSVPSVVASVPAFLKATNRQTSATISAADVAAYATWYKANVVSFSDVAETTALLQYWIGKKWSDVIGQAIPWPNVDPVANIQGAIANLPAALGNVAAHVGILVAVLAIIVLGLYLVATESLPVPGASS